LAELGGNASRAWNIFDFLYFSLITQTTVGYGDILPNSTKVRAVVIVQILLGLFLLSVAINQALPSLSSAPRNGNQDDRLTGDARPAGG
jgi:uncharacterized membrane protein